MNSDPKVALTRRAFGAGMTGSLSLLGMTGPVSASESSGASNDSIFRDAALRGLARAGDRGDPVLAAKAEAALVQLERRDPEGAMLVRIYRIYDAGSAVSRYGDTADDQVTADDLAALHEAVHDCRAVSFRYVDMEGNVTVRTVLPLALVHPPKGVKLLAWCEKRQDIRQFYVRSLTRLTLQPTHFSDRRMALLRQLADSAALRA